MKRFTPRKLTHKLLFLFVLLMVVASCEKDDIIKNPTPNAKHIISKIVSGKQIQSNQQLFEMFPEYRYNNVQNRPLEGNRNIVFDTDYARYFEYGDYHSYTFPVLNTPYGEGLENIVFWLNDEGGYNIALVYYALTEEEKVYLEHGISIHPEDVLITTLNEEYEPMGLFDTPCFYIILAYCRYDNHVGGRYEDGGRCPGYAEYVTPVGDCGSGGTGGSGDPPPPPPPPNPDDPPPHGSGGFGPNPYSSPTLPPYYQPIKDLYIQIANDLPSEHADNIRNWLHANPTIAMDMAQFLNLYLGDLSLGERKGLLMQGFDFLVENGYSLDSSEIFKKAIEGWMKNKNFDFAEIIDAANDGTLVSAFPFFKYPDGSNYSTQYENLTVLLKEYIPTLSTDSRLLNIINQLTGVSVSEIANDLKWNKGPEVHIEDLGVDANGDQYKGKFNPSEPNKIFIDIDLVNYLEQLSDIENPTSQEQQQLSLLNGLIVFSVCLHELVHYEDFQFDGNMQDTPHLELGLLFEELFNGGYYEFDPNGQIIIIKAD